MEKHGNKLLLAFLVFSLLLLLVSIFYRGETSTGLSGEITIKGTTSVGSSEGTTSVGSSEGITSAGSSEGITSVGLSEGITSAGSSEDRLKMDSSTLIDYFTKDTRNVLKKKISLESYDLKGDNGKYWKLPGSLEEISGLAMTADNRLLAHNDEKGVIHEIDYQKGEIIKEFQLADTKTPVSDDFEGIAIVNDKVYLVTSSGRIYECSRGADGESVLYNIYATGIGKDYEIEGLAYDANQRVLLLMCKEARRTELKEQLVIYHWSTDEKQFIDNAHIVIPVIAFSRIIKEKEFQPSGIERHPLTGNYFVIAARQSAIAEITPDGQVIAAKKFRAGYHRQAEGITFTSDGTLIIADEGSGKKARLTVYPVSENSQ